MDLISIIKLYICPTDFRNLSGLLFKYYSDLVQIFDLQLEDFCQMLILDSHYYPSCYTLPSIFDFFKIKGFELFLNFFFMG
jgi:hypothetical protein